MKKQNNELAKLEVVYVLLSKAQKSFFISRGAKETLRETYRHHVKQRRYYSKNFIESIAPERPCLFILEEIDPKEEADLMIVWLRILLENGFASFNTNSVIEYANCLYIDNDIAYRQRKDVDLSQLLSCSNCLIPKYNGAICPLRPHENEGNQSQKTAQLINKQSRKRSKEVRICVTEEEYDAIRQKAYEAGMSMSPYIRQVAMNPLIRKYNYEAIQNHTKEIGAIRNCINRLIFTIEATNNYLPRQISSIIDLMNGIFESENQLLKTLRKQRNSDSEPRD